MEQEKLIWGLVIISLFPVFNVIIGEGIERLKRKHNPLAKCLYNLREFVLPSLVILLLLEKILGFTETNSLLQLIKTSFWLATLYTIISLLNIILTSEKKQEKWQILLPNLLFQFARFTVIISIIAYVIADIWKIDLSQVFTALGVGSLVMALALQDTLSNLVSGFLLIFESPFKIGDWIKIKEGIEGEVIEINWRSVRLKTIDKDIIIIPNSALGREMIYNYTLMDPLHAERLILSFSFNNSPNQVQKVIKNTALETPGIVAVPEPEIMTKKYLDHAIEYEIKYFITEYVKAEKIRNDLMTRIYYAAKRHGLKSPIPGAIEYQGDLEILIHDDSPEKILQFLKSLSYFANFDHQTINQLVQNATLENYGIGEQIIKTGEFDLGFYIIMRGDILLSAINNEGKEQKIMSLTTGDFFGEMSLLQKKEPSLFDITVISDLEVIAITPNMMVNVIQKFPKFAIEMNQFIEERQKAVRKFVTIKEDDKLTQNTILNSIFSR